MAAKDALPQGFHHSPARLGRHRFARFLIADFHLITLILYHDFTYMQSFLHVFGRKKKSPPDIKDLQPQALFVIMTVQSAKQLCEIALYPGCPERQQEEIK